MIAPKLNRSAKCTNNVHRVYTQIFMLNELGYLNRKITLTLIKELLFPARGNQGKDFEYNVEVNFQFCSNFVSLLKLYLDLC